MTPQIKPTKFTREYLADVCPLALTMDGYDDCIIGIGHSACSHSVVVYDKTKVIERLMKEDGMSADEAEGFFWFNQAGAYVGKGSPIFLDTSFGTLEHHIDICDLDP